VQGLVADAKRHWERIDILVCNAATNILGMAATMPDEQWKRVIDTELSGYYYLARAVYPVMRRRSRFDHHGLGEFSLVGSPNSVGVAVAKGGVDIDARTLRLSGDATDSRPTRSIRLDGACAGKDGGDVAAAKAISRGYIRVMTARATRPCRRVCLSCDLPCL